MGESSKEAAKPQRDMSGGTNNTVTMPAQGKDKAGSTPKQSGNAQDVGEETDDGNVALFSVSPSTQQEYENRIDELFEGGKAKFAELGTKVLDRSGVLDLLGYGNQPVYLEESKVIKGMTNHPNITAEHWKNVPN